MDAVMRAADLDREITLQTATASQSTSGESTFDWDNAAEQTLWAEWLPAGAKELYVVQRQIEAQIDGAFRIYDLDPRPQPDSSRIEFEGRLYDLKGWSEIGRGQGLLLLVVARGESA